MQSNMKILFNQTEIQGMVANIAKQLNNDYKDKESIPVLCPVLSGAAMFANDLMKQLDFKYTVSYCKYSSYEGTQCTELKEILPIPQISQDRDIIIIEDLIDTGQTISNLVTTLKERGNNVKICALFSKPSKHTQSVESLINYKGSDIEDKFIIGDR